MVICGEGVRLDRRRNRFERGIEGLDRIGKRGSGLRGEGGVGLVISSEGGMVIIGSYSFREIAFGAGGEKGMGSAEGTSSTPKPRSLGGEGEADGGDIAQVEALSRHDESVSSVECLQRSFQLGG